ncbi:hypothetical protein J1761_gp53 [Gordonia phage Kroos]|uniref:Helix-turn-helix DNA binding protein n=3 Tax=Kroosvirus TaxID=2948789 RepID=A0A515ML04_9CAUD|nr:hypothetical protein J1761_gp53 [Gordonia phage Kroos]YP_010001763.1 helix-turn-helix DNA binding domain protein [Gordonia phage YorkOnyx]YP_010002101.1 helix-turn-helix DNA binding protein [Gordonia phage Tangerine]UAJ15721.1 helix-turn-helix DNA binding domain protein [Gordonia phage Baddon]WMI33062.1 helix-turn-helix DNA binding protein [Gordonia Phage SchottB]AYR03032.1 hypothetical protein SEA_KROOS_53 [Gordonia phage Kroos]QDM57351.1 helix-turn-helix DNA binding protein [Gordonia pha
MTEPAAAPADQGALNIDDTAVYLGRISRRQVYRLIEAGHLDRIHIGRRAVVTRASCDRYLASLVDTHKAAQ